MTTFINIILIKATQAKRITWARRGCEGHRPIQNFKGAGGLLLLLLLLLPAACCLLLLLLLLPFAHRILAKSGKH